MTNKIVTILALFLLSPLSALACSCLFRDPPEAFNEAEAVFIGKMLGGTEKFSVKTSEGVHVEREAGQVRFEISEVFKSKIKAHSEVVLKVDSMRGTSCGDYGLERGETYVVYAYADKQNPGKLYTGVCTRTAIADPQHAKEDLDYLRNLPVPGSGGNLRGRIWFDNKKVMGGGADPLAGVEMVVRGPDGKEVIATTDHEGKFEIVRLKAGKYRVTPKVPADYFLEEAFEEVDVADRGTAQVLFEAYFNGRISGRALDINGRGYNSLTLQLQSVGATDEKHIFGESDGKNGAFSFAGVPPGEYLMYMDLQRNGPDDAKRYYFPGTFNKEDATKIKVDLGREITGLTFNLPGD